MFRPQVLRVRLPFRVPYLIVVELVYTLRRDRKPQCGLRVQIPPMRPIIMISIKKPKRQLTAIEEIQLYEDRKAFRIINKFIKKDGIMEVATYPCALGYCLIGTHSQIYLASVELGATVDDCYRTFIRRWNTTSHRNSLLIKTGLPDGDVVNAVLEAVNTGISRNHIQLSLNGTHFQNQVWDELSKTTSGTTLTYKQLAERIKSPSAVRAVANAVAANPLAIVIPCHRVIRSDGTLGGYRWGEDIKRKILNREEVTT